MQKSKKKKSLQVIKKVKNWKKHPNKWGILWEKVRRKWYTKEIKGK